MTLESIIKRTKRTAINSIKVGLTAAMLSIGCGGNETSNPVSPSNDTPETWITEGPTGTISNNDVTFRWSGGDSDGYITNFLYKIDNSAESQVSSLTTHHTFYDLTEGQHTFRVRAKDNSGLMDPTPATRTFEIAPSTPIPTTSAFIASATGGTISSNGYEVVIPQGVLSQDATVTISTQEDVREITTDDATRVTPAMNISINASCDEMKIRFPEQELTEDLVGIVDLDSQYNLGELSLSGNKLEFTYSQEHLLRPSEAVDIDAWIMSFPYQIQPVVLDRRGVSLSSSERVALLIHGLGSHPDVFDDALLPLLNDIYNNRVMTFQYPSGQPISTNGSNLEREINNLGSTPFKFDVIAHSMGGLVARSFARNNPNKIDNLITLGSPHHGVLNTVLTSFVENLLNLRIAGAFNPYSSGAKDATTGSPFLNTLNSPGLVNSHYFLISGNLGGEIPIPGEDDGLVSVVSAELGDYAYSLGSSTYPQQESVLSWQRNRFFTNHQGLKNAQVVMDEIRDILEIEEPQTIVLQPGPEGIDTFVEERSPDWNNGTLTAFHIRGVVGDRYRAYLKFDLSSIPREMNIDLATFILTGQSYTGPSIISLREPLSHWEENTLTWRNQPGYGLSILEMTIFGDGQYNFDITTSVRNWLINPSANHGLVMISRDEFDGSKFAFWSSDYLNPIASPRLVITGSIP